MIEETTKELMTIDPKNFYVKFEYTKNLLYKNEIWRGLSEYMRTRSLCEERLRSSPDDSRLLQMMSDLE